MSLQIVANAAGLLPNTANTLKIQHNNDSSDSKKMPKTQSKLKEKLKHRLKRETQETLCAISVKTVDVRDLEKYSRPLCGNPQINIAEVKTTNTNIQEASKVYKMFLPLAETFEQKITIEKCNCENPPSSDVRRFSCVQKYSKIKIRIKETEDKTFEYPSFCALKINKF